MIKIFILSIKLNHYFLLYNTPATITDINVNHPNPLPTLPTICPGNTFPNFTALSRNFPFFSVRGGNLILLGYLLLVSAYITGLRCEQLLNPINP